MNQREKIKELVNKISKTDHTCEHNHHIHTPFELCSEYVKSVELSDSVLVLFNIEFLAVLHERCVDASKITFFTTCSATAAIASNKYNVVTDINELKNMKFDVVVGNPPYQKGLAEEFVKLSMKVCTGKIFMVIPYTWLNYNKNPFRIFILSSGHVSSLDWVQKKGKKSYNTFPTVNQAICVLGMDMSKNYDNITVTGFDGITKDLPHDNLSLDGSISIEIFKKTCKFDNVVDSRYLPGGRIRRTELKNLPKGNYDVLRTTLQRVESVDNVAGLIGAGKHKVAISSLSTSAKLGLVTTEGTSTLAGSSILFLETNNELESNILKTYLESKFVRYIVNAKKVGACNTQNLLSNIPNIDLTNEWTDEDLYVYFGLTDEEINEIEGVYPTVI